MFNNTILLIYANMNNNIEYLNRSCREVCDARHIHDLAVLHQVADELSTATRQRQVLHNILRILEDQPRMTNSTIMLLDSDAKTLTVEELGQQGRQDKGSFTYSRGEGIVGRVLESGTPSIVPNVSSEPLFKNRIHRRHSASQISFICTPIQLGNETLGVLTVDHDLADETRLKEVERLLSIVASMVAYDIHNRRVQKLEREKMEAEKLTLITKINPEIQKGKMLGDSDAMRFVFSRIQQVAPTDVTVLIRGESGSGKELAAAALHYNSLRANKPFVKVNCAALNEGVLESELFGHEKGAFTGASFARNGRISEAEGGTLFLDEIGDFSISIQIKLLRVIQEREYERVGSNETHRADVRLLAATNRDLEQLIEKDMFREDLYYRINVFPLYLPPLRNRRSDILLLANYFADKYSGQTHRSVRRISSSAIQLLMSYHWPGNVRELENCMAHAVLMCEDGTIQGRHFPPTLQAPSLNHLEMRGTLKRQVEILERDMIIDALKRHDGSINQASKELGITDRMVRYKIKKLDIPYNDFFRRKKKKRT